MSATVTITPGFLPPDGSAITCAILRQIAQPSASANFSIPPATVNFVRNGNFNKTLWSNLTSVSATSPNTELMQLSNAFYWTVQATPTGAGKVLTILPSTDVPSQISYYSHEIDATSAGFTTLGLLTQIPSDISSVLEGQQVTISFYLKNIQSGSTTPTANFLSPSTQDGWAGGVTNIASASMQAAPQGTWTKMSATATLSNALVNNGLQVEIDFPLGSLTALAGGVVQFRFSEMFLQIGTVSTSFQSDPDLTRDVVAPQFGRILFGPTGSVVSTINGDSQVWQRNTSFAAVANATKVSDRFQTVLSMGTGVATVAQNAIELPNVANQYPHTKYSTRITVTTAQASIAAGNFFGVSQRIERQFARALFDGTSSLQLVLQASAVGVYCVAIRSSTSGNSIIYECPIGVAATPYRFTFQNIPAMPSTASGGNWGTADTDFAYEIDVMAACGSTFQAPALGAWQSANYMASANQANLFATNGNTLDITLLQHEAGPVCTPFLWTPFDAALGKCRRYYQKTFEYGTFAGAITSTGEVFGSWQTGNLLLIYWRFPIQMRITPASANVVTYSTASATTALVRDVSSGTDLASSTYVASMDGLLACTTNASTAGHLAALQATVDVEL